MSKKPEASGASFAFTQRRIADLPAPVGRASWHHDTTTPGLSVTVSPLGKRVFYLVTRGGGRTRRAKIGGFPQLSVSQARIAVKEMVGDVARGKPVWERRTAGQRTINDLAQHWFDDYAAPAGLRMLARQRRAYARLLEPTIGRLAVTGLKRDQIRGLIATIQREGGVGPAKAMHGLLSSMLSLALDNGWIDVHPMHRLKRPDVAPRQRYLKPAELATFFRAVGELRSQMARDYLLLLLFTGQRRAVVAAMEWTEIDGDVWRIPPAKAKSKRAQQVPLTSHALQILETRRGNGSRWVFPSERTDSHVVDTKSAWERVLKLSGLKDLRPHDLRRSMGAWQQKGGASLQTIGQSLGHSDIGVTSKHYAPVESAQVRESMESAIDAMLAAGR